MAQPIPSSRIDLIMKPPFTSAELRHAAHQATMLALSSWCPQARKSLLEAAERLMVEADDAMKPDLVEPAGRKRIPPAHVPPHSMHSSR